MAELEEHEVLEEKLVENKQVEEHFDFDGKSDEQLLDILKKMAQDDVSLLGNKLHAVQDAFFERYNAKKKDALDKFIADGGVKQDFELRDDEVCAAIKNLIINYGEQIKKIKKDQNEQIITNFKRKEVLLAELRNLVHEDEAEHTFKRVKEIQEEWKGIGDIPANKKKDIYPNYRALLDIFYNNRGIYFELKDLDRKKNQDKKIQICEAAEKLLELDSAKEMTKSLQDLHHQYKNIGPVAKEVQEELWERFKVATQKVYDFKDKVNAEFVEKLKANLELKKALIEKIAPFTEFETTVINEWKAKTEELLKVQNEWKAIGPVPRADSKEISKDFWGKGKQFFNAKSAFFKTLDKKREDALAQKEVLCEKVEQLSSLEDVGEACHQAINIQKEWKKIGPAPKAVNDKIYKRFKEACDVLFNTRRTKQDEAEKSLVVNLDGKKTLLASIDEVFESGVPVEVVEAYFEKWNEIGEVPTSSRHDLNKELQTALVNKIDASNADNKDLLKVIVEKEIYKNDRNAERIFMKKITAVRKKVSGLEDDISTWGNNLMFFKNSASFEELKKEFDDKIEAATLQIAGLKEQLKVLRKK